MAPVRESRTVTSSSLRHLRRCAKAEQKVSATLLNSVYRLGGSRGADEDGIGVSRSEESVTGSGLGIRGVGDDDRWLKDGTNVGRRGSLSILTLLKILTGYVLSEPRSLLLRFVT